jgi:hypothetical protein
MFRYARAQVLLFGLAFCLVTPLKSFCAIPYSFSNGTIADATEVNANNNYLENKFSTTSGHDHDGSDSKKVSDVSGVTTGILPIANGGTGVATKTVDLTGIVTGILASANGGTGVATADLVDYSQTRVKIGSFTRDMTAVSGDVSYTGVGFKPVSIIFIGVPAASGSVLGASVGFDTVTNRGGIGENSLGIWYSLGYSGGLQSIILEQTAGKGMEAVVKSFDADGFTLTWLKVGASDAGTATIYYMAFR